MRGRSTLTADAAQVQFVLEAEAESIDLDELFPTDAPVELDLGCGDGSFITALAAEHPERNFLGVERMIGRVRSACRRIAARRLANARIVRAEIGHAVGSLLPAGSVDVCHVMFPDPWPKRRHHIRRTVTADLLRAIARILKPSGLLRLTTDDAAYFEQMERAAAAVPEFASQAWGDELLLPQSTFEMRFVNAGLPIHRLVLRKVSPVRCDDASQ
jgi:tRNA (guanine-N7-)-methyltransferase